MYNPFKKKSIGKGSKKRAKGAIPEGTKQEEAFPRADAIAQKEYLRGVLIVPRITEKATAAAERSQYVFEVSSSANAYQIRHAVEEKWGVHVRKINIVNHHGKEVRLGRSRGRRPGFKKAYVTVRKGEAITFA